MSKPEQSRLRRQVKEQERELRVLRGQGPPSDGRDQPDPVPVEVYRTDLEYKEFDMPSGQRVNLPVVAGVLEVPARFPVNLLPGGTVYRRPEEVPQKTRKWTAEWLIKACDDPEIEGINWIEIEVPHSHAVKVNGVGWWLQAGVLNRVPSPIAAVERQSRAETKSTVRGQDGREWVPAVGQLEPGAFKQPGTGPIGGVGEEGVVEGALSSP
jgi:hypothetical protein